MHCPPPLAHRCMFRPIEQDATKSRSFQQEAHKIVNLVETYSTHIISPPPYLDARKNPPITEWAGLYVHPRI